jgi:tetratricopeptide (TPR) repeat protein
MKRRTTTLAAIVALASMPSRAHAAGRDLWDRIRDPAADKAERALTVALRARTPKDVPPDLAELAPDLDELLAWRAATVLEMAGGEALGTPRVWFFLGDALVAANRGRDEDGRRILWRALAAEPESPEAAHAWFDVAIASNRLSDFEGERKAYDEALCVEWDQNKRAGIYMNRGEASMSLGELRAAREDYLRALATTNESEIHALAAWGLAVASARDEDLPEALAYAWEASQMVFRGPSGQPITALELPSVFFTPPHEVLYYRALAAMAASEHAKDDRERRSALETAGSLWRDYLKRAREHGDRWVANAEYQARWVERRLASKKR